jgi:lysophospholipase L1-like esterase
MAITTLPAVGQGEALGPTKSNRRTVSNAARQVSADEWNALATWVQEAAQAVGLSDGSTNGSLIATSRSLRAPATIAAFGDSLSDLSYDLVAGTPNRHVYQGIAYLTWANVFLGQRLRFDSSLNFGVSGDASEDALARIDDVLEAAPDVCVVEVGSNDVEADVSPADTIAALESIYEQLIAAGILVVTFPILPRQWGGTAPEQATKTARAMRINRWIRRYALEHQGIVLADPVSELADPASSISAMRSEMTFDGTHPTVLGAMVIGRHVANAIATITSPMAPLLPSHAADVYDADENPEGNLLANGMLTGTGGSKAGEVTGDVADGCSLVRFAGSYGAGSVVASKVTRTDVPGDWQVITASGMTGGADPIYAFTQEIAGSAGDYDVGDVVELACEIEVEGASGLEGVLLVLYEYSGAGAQVTAAEAGALGTETEAEWSGIMRTPPITLSAALGASSKLSANVAFQMTGTGSAGAVIRVGRVDLRKVIS